MTGKIGFYIGQLECGGSERQLFLITRALRRMGVEVCVITNQEGGYWQSRLDEAGVIVDCIPHGLRLVRAARLRRSLVSLQVSTLFCFGTAEAIYGRMAAAGTGIIAIPCLRNQQWGGRRGESIDRLLRYRTPVYTANSLAGLEYLVNTIGITPERVVIIPNAVDLHEIRSSQFELAADLFEAPRDELVWGGWVGSMDWRKDPLLMLDVVENVSWDTSRFRMLVVGDGPLFSDLKQAAKQRGLDSHLVFTGRIDGAMGIWKYLDFGLSTSMIEGSPNVCLEAMAWGKPYIAPRVGDYPHLIRHGDNGLLSQTRSVDELVSLVLTMINDPPFREHLSAGSRTTSMALPTPESAATSILNLSHRLHSQPG